MQISNFKQTKIISYRGDFRLKIKQKFQNPNCLISLLFFSLYFWCLFKKNEGRGNKSCKRFKFQTKTQKKRKRKEEANLLLIFLNEAIKKKREKSGILLLILKYD